MNTAAELRYREVIDANQKVHTALAAVYNTSEPHFRPENIVHVEGKLQSVFARTGTRRLLDLGCGTGFIINIAKKYVTEIDGVDVTEAMLQQVDKSGGATIRLHLGDTGAFSVEPGAYDVVTAYSFLHHLYDVGPTLKTAAQGLRPGGQFFCDLEPNRLFWETIKSLDPAAVYHPIVERERASVMEKDTEIQDKFKIDKGVFNQAEYNKNITGGFSEEALTRELLAAGFREVSFTYYWFLGQAALVNDPVLPREQRLLMASRCAEILQHGLPLTRHLFKYMGFVATR
jgi:2-polyprenyl-3-methyl-5-hydroxy-6-metoxy-1,4-benzoquinol methylase